jgi:hypothetical protein
MPAHNWIHDSQFDTPKTVRWACTICGQISDFSLPGEGDPSSDGLSVPKGIDAYVNPCIDQPQVIALSLAADLQAALAIAVSLWQQKIAPFEAQAKGLITDQQLQAVIDFQKQQVP